VLREKKAIRKCLLSKKSSRLAWKEEKGKNDIAVERRRWGILPEEKALVSGVCPEISASKRAFFAGKGRKIDRKESRREKRYLPLFP